MIVSRYGLHQAAGIPFLLQTTGGSNLISKDLKCPIQVQVTPRRTLCPHQIDLDTFVEAPEWVQDPLAQAFLPVPRRPDEKVMVVVDPDGTQERLAFHLARLCSPTMGLAHPLWGRLPSEMEKWYRVTDISPVVLIGAEMQHTTLVRKHVALARATNRRTVILSKERLPLYGEVEWINSKLSLTDIDGQPLEAIGSGALREAMDRIS